jgi:hypothetical protein
MRIEELVVRPGDEVLYIKPRDRQIIGRERVQEEDYIIRVTHKVYGADKERIPSA